MHHHHCCAHTDSGADSLDAIVENFLPLLITRGVDRSSGLVAEGALCVLQVAALRDQQLFSDPVRDQPSLCLVSFT